ncbi:hypothetical protein RF11_15825 [Thelohanellus kitauei]|uniref:Uncharacterized protein n=1 Tax=Thelohanellus kitauei TaxID=669202 RepID=A0A0C2ML20_THEKT|nr:hypothetical protein RF11_15825 [Thelohanellus kitauei]
MLVIAIYSIKKRNGLGLRIGVVLSIKARIVCVDADHNQVNARGVLNHVKKDARISQFSTQQVVASNVIGINQSTASALPPLPSMTRLFQRTRRDTNTPLPSHNCHSLISLPINDFWYCDGTSKTASSLFSQLYMVHCKINHTVIPTVYGLLSTNNLKPDLLLSNIILHLRISSHNALRRVSPQTILKGCFYHFLKVSGAKFIRIHQRVVVTKKMGTL